MRFRRNGVDVYLTGAPFSDAFLRQYWTAMEGKQPDRSAVPPPARVAPGSMNELAQAYLRSPEFKGLRASTQDFRRNIIKRLCDEHGDKPVKLLARRHVSDMIGAKADTPMAANNLLKVLRYMLALAVDREMIASNPAIGVKLYRSDSEGHHTWTEEEHVKYVTRHPFGTKAYLAEALLLYTMQRKGDVVRMGWQHVVRRRDDDGIERDYISFKQEKTNEPMMIPIIPKLWDALQSLPRKNLTFLMTEQGAPFTSGGFGNWFRDRCNEAGLPQCSAHGLRKLGAVRLSEAGCTQEQIKALGGWRSDSSVRPYLRKVDKAKLARQASAALAGPDQEQRMSSSPILLDKMRAK